MFPRKSSLLTTVQLRGWRVGACPEIRNQNEDYFINMQKQLCTYTVSILTCIITQKLISRDLSCSEHGANQLFLHILIKRDEAWDIYRN